MKKYLAFLFVMAVAAGVSYGADLTVESEHQHYKEADNKINLDGSVKVKYDDINVTSPHAEVIINPALGKVEKVKFLDNAYSYQIKQDKKHEVKAKILEVSLLNKVFKAEERTQSTIIQKNQPTVIVTADNQEYDNQANIMKARGGVIIYYQDSQAFADYAEVDLAKDNSVKRMILSGHASVTRKDSTIKADKFVHYADKKVTTASGKVFSDINDENTKIKVWSDFQQIDQKTNVVTASGHTIVHYQDFVAEGPKASVYPDAKTNKLNQVVFLGRSKITQQGRSIEADRINMTLNPKDFKADGNVKTFLPNVGSGNNSL
ncbi:MAG: hypothetical protein K6C94_01135 [Candidatus Gastranaerophilales bacterium]|nr:hypothetical protein [Candidatus Gastranaerophilales bacterium]